MLETHLHINEKNGATLLQIAVHDFAPKWVFFP